MVRGGLTVDRIPLGDLVGPAEVVRIRKGPGDRIDSESLDPSGLEEPRVILDTGWHKHWGKNDYYKDFPRVTEDLADLLVERGVRCLVVDLPLTLEVHNIMLGSGACLVENVVGLDQVTADRVKLVALPLRIEGIEAAPARVIVIEGM
jgi:arylformamidase